MSSCVILRLLLMGFLVAQVPAGRVKSVNPADDEQLQSSLAAARNSGLPHLMLLADHIGWMIEDGKFDDPADFKIGVRAVFRHGDFSTDLVLGELYLRTGNLEKAKERLEILDDAYIFGCEEFDDLKQAIKTYEANIQS